MSEEKDVIRTGAALVRCDNDRWLTPKDLTAPLVICVHGFTSHGRYMIDLAQYIEGYGFIAALFHYDSYLGIDQASAVLLDRLQPLISNITHRSFVLIGHSMGGLVARAFARSVQSPLREALKGIALLGTPNRGTLGKKKLVSYMLDWGDWLTGPNPYARSPIRSKSAKQLTLNDTEQFIESLNRADQKAPLGMQMHLLSISGGRAFLESGKYSESSYSGIFRNTMLQRLIGEKPNDGLVAESSADITRVIGKSNKFIQHNNKYADYPRTNHTYLIRNQSVANVIVSWLQKVIPPPQV